VRDYKEKKGGRRGRRRRLSEKRRPFPKQKGNRLSIKKNDEEQNETKESQDVEKREREGTLSASSLSLSQPHSSLEHPSTINSLHDGQWHRQPRRRKGEIEEDEEEAMKHRRARRKHVAKNEEIMMRPLKQRQTSFKIKRRILDK